MSILQFTVDEPTAVKITILGVPVFDACVRRLPWS